MYLCSDQQNALYKMMATYERSYLEEQNKKIAEQNKKLLQVMGALLKSEINNRACGKQPPKNQSSRGTFRGRVRE